MNNKVLLMILLPAMSCAAVQPESVNPAVEITASLQQSRLSIDAEGHSAFNAGDAVSIFYGGKMSEFTTRYGGMPATFTGTIEESGVSSAYVGLYPYDKEATFDGTSVSTLLPSTQTAVAGDYSRNIRLAMSADKDLLFRNACGALKFRLESDDIRSLVLRSAGGVPLAGKVSFSFDGDTPVAGAVSEASDSIVFEPSSGTFRAGEWYYVAVLPGTQTSFTLTLRKTDKKASVALSSYAFKRNKNKVLDCPDRGAVWTDAPLYIWAADDVIRASIAAETIPGAVLSVVKGREVVYKKAFGLRRVNPQAEATTEDTVYDLASVTKPVGTALSVMQLAEQGLVDLNAPIGTYLSAFDPEEDITLTQLLTHTSGFPNYQNYISTAGYAGRPDSLLVYMATEHPRLDKSYRYSCLNFFLCQQVVEAVSGQRICDYAPAHIFLPLGMTDTRYHPAGEELPEAYFSRMAPGAATITGDAQDALARVVCGGNAGNAGLFSTVTDLSTLAIALLNGGEWKGARILQEATVRQMAAPVAYGRTLGWDNSSTASTVKGTKLSDNLICHTGYSGTFILVDFDNDLAIVLLANRCHPKDTGYAALNADRAKVCNAVADALLK